MVTPSCRADSARRVVADHEQELGIELDEATDFDELWTLKERLAIEQGWNNVAGRLLGWGTWQNDDNMELLASLGGGHAEDWTLLLQTDALDAELYVALPDRGPGQGPFRPRPGHRRIRLSLTTEPLGARLISARKGFRRAHLRSRECLDGWGARQPAGGTRSSASWSRSRSPGPSSVAGSTTARSAWRARAGSRRQAQERLDELGPEGELVVAVMAGEDFSRPNWWSATQVMYEIRELPGVKEVPDAYTAGGMIADDKQSSLAVVELEPGLDEDAALAVADRVAAELRTIQAPEVLVGGKLLAERTFAEQAIEDAVFGEAVALVVLLRRARAFVGGVAGALPLLAALATIAGTLLALTRSRARPVSEYAVNVVTLLGLGLAVDYSLLMLARFREERAADPEAALPELLARTTPPRAGRCWSPGSRWRSRWRRCSSSPTRCSPPWRWAARWRSAGHGRRADVGARAGRGGAPAHPGAGDAHLGLAARADGAGAAGAAGRFAQRRPALVALAVTAALLALAVPALGLNVANADARSLPAEQRGAAGLRGGRARLHPGTVDPIDVLIEAAHDQPERPLIGRMPTAAQRRGRHAVGRPAAAVTGLEVDPAGPDAGERAQALVRRSGTSTPACWWAGRPPSSWTPRTPPPSGCRSRSRSSACRRCSCCLRSPAPC